MSVKKNITKGASNEVGKIDFGWMGVIFLMAERLGKMPDQIEGMKTITFLMYFGWITNQDVR